MAIKGSLESIIEVAKKEIGTIEEGDNLTKYGAWAKAQGLPWCQSFVSWCAFTSGLDPKKYPKTASTVAASDWFKKTQRWADARNDDPTPGDWIFFDFPDDGVNRISHVGLCIKNNGNGTIQVIEGNTSGTNKGDQRNGGMCVEKTRAYVKDNAKNLMNAVVGWGRPVYTGEENLSLLSRVESRDVKTTIKKPKVVDPKENATKVIKKTTHVSVQKKVKDPIKKNFTNMKIDSRGEHIKIVQEKLGLFGDGVFGEKTLSAVKEFQKLNNLPATGIVDYNLYQLIKKKEKNGIN
jgi:hypothetical protein